jgi:hypothetical protein
MYKPTVDVTTIDFSPKTGIYLRRIKYPIEMKSINDVILYKI